MYASLQLYANHICLSWSIIIGVSLTQFSFSRSDFPFKLLQLSLLTPLMPTPLRPAVSELLLPLPPLQTRVLVLLLQLPLWKLLLSEEVRGASPAERSLVALVLESEEDEDEDEDELSEVVMTR